MGDALLKDGILKKKKKKNQRVGLRIVRGEPDSDGHSTIGSLDQLVPQSELTD